MSADLHDLAVVGGGVIGLCTGLEAKRRRPAARIVVVERAEIGAGASRYAPGIQVPIGRTDVERDLARRGLQAWDRLFPGASWPVGRRCALFWVASDAARLRVWHVGNGPIASDHSNLETRLSNFANIVIPVDRVVFADWCSYSPVQYIVAELLRRFKEIGGEVREEFDVVDILPQTSAVDLRSSDGGLLHAKRAVVAVGPWLPGSNFLGQAKLDGRPRVKKVVSFHLDRRPTLDCPAIGLQEDYAFLIPMIENGYWLFSFTSTHWDVLPISRALRVDDVDVDRGMEILRKWFPVATPGILSTRVFCDCYSTDGIPFVARHRTSEKVAFVGGGSGNGFRFGPPCANDALDAVWPPNEVFSPNAGRGSLGESVQ